jgi:glycosyltransferase involved in cell wall biosynthesis
MRVYATVATRFTIAIPTHNRRETVLLAARSALAQTRPPEQIIVLCDGCDDGTGEAVRSLGSPLTDAIELPKAPGYAYGHRNRSLELARGEVILWLADDDLLLPDHLERIGAQWDCGRFDLVQSDGARPRRRLIEVVRRGLEHSPGTRPARHREHQSDGLGERPRGRGAGSGWMG